MNIALVLSGGAGTRLGSRVPKQYLEVCGRPMISFCLETLLCHEGISALHIAAEPIWRELIQEWICPYDRDGKFRSFCEPGENRQLSVLHGLEAAKGYAGDADCVLIHDAARPLLSSGQITDCLETMAACGADGVMPALPMKDTVYASRDGKSIFALLDCRGIFAGQAPEVFRFWKYYGANIRLTQEEILQVSGSAEPAVMAGLDIALIQGDERNFKITTEADLRRFEGIMEKNGRKSRENQADRTEEHPGKQK